jgi:phosphoglycolate phosphatase-like HAD superfamily hydrolase
MKLILFDIDGTLLLTDGAGTAAMNRAFAQLYGVHDGFVGVRMAGKMDPAILAEALGAAGLPADDGARFWDAYVPLLHEELRARAGRGRVLPGVPLLLDCLNGSTAHVSGILTGNHRGGAEAKLEHFGLTTYFRVGAYGSDAARREDLVALATRRLRNRYGIRAEGRDVVVIGDTPRDVRCAAANGATAVAVATGPFTADDLAAEGADAVFEDLSDTDAVMQAIT